ncbi:glycoside hydrolase family 16 protein [Streptacidiphilus melanogenes]|uniref:glycoside hydrolase family 16 protein n=1 Tax=Streptacidiphilus melanogenes TaxID=411235 RepID=UPI0005AAF1F7|nr:glycoside hydrolase family 16 protein [Streptacidiphilus melanogenes]
MPVGRRLWAATACLLLGLTAACGGTSPGSGAAGAAGSGESGGSVVGAPPGTSGSSASNTGSTPAASGSWNLVFSDDFGGDSLDTAHWATCYDWNDSGCTNAGNRELEWYQPGQVSVADGTLNLEAKRTPTQGSDGKTYPWTSGMVTTGRDSWNAQPRETFLHGYFAASIRIPPQAGMFPAFWLLPAEHNVPQEIDIAEFSGTTQAVQNTLHWQKSDGGAAQRQNWFGPVNFPAGFHVFGVDWEPKSVTWYVDGVARWRIADPAEIPTLPMEVILNLAVGYPYAPPANVNQADMQVQWVKVWQH